MCTYTYVWGVDAYDVLLVLGCGVMKNILLIIIGLNNNFLLPTYIATCLQLATLQGTSKLHTL